MEAAWSEMKVNISLSNKINGTDAEVSTFHEKLRAALHTAVTRCRRERKRKSAGTFAPDLSDEALRLAARHTDRLPLANYDGILHLVPRLVNVVTLAEAIPVPGSGVTLPLDLQAIAARCTNAYYAPKRFAAVQLAFSNPRCRVLIFHTGRLVGTGCSGPMAARLAILKAARQLAVEANVHVTIRNFSVINQVGAVSIDAKLDCDAFASTHSATSHYDRASFVGARACTLAPAHPAPTTHPRCARAQASLGAQAVRQCAARSTRRARPTCPGRRASATCSRPFRAWSRSCCATRTGPTSARSCPSTCSSATGPGTWRATTHR